ncbi:MAG: hypothetical protein QXX94_07745 [Candidatus Bathyarchaeia archaeon]
MSDMDELKSQLYEFVEFRSEPFDVKFILGSCIQLIDRHHVYEALYQLESEGKIIRLSDGRYTTTRVAIKRWIKNKFTEVLVPDYLIREIERILKIKPGICRSTEEFISKAIKEYIEKVKGNGNQMNIPNNNLNKNI